MIVTKDDLLLFEELARKNYTELPAHTCLWGETSVITEREHRWLCHLKACISLLQTKGLLDKTANIEVEEPQHEPLEEM